MKYNSQITRRVSRNVTRRLPAIFAFSIFTFAIAAAGLMMASCAKIEPEDTDALETMAFEAWIKKYVLDEGIPAVKQSNGMYVEFLEDGDQSVESSRDTTLWLRLDYTARDISGNVFATRDSVQALRQRTFTPLTYYVPEYIFCSEQTYGMSKGRHFALRGDLEKPDGTTMKMSVGSHVRLYMPPFLAYGSKGFSDDQGYGGQFQLEGSKVVIEELAVRDVVKDPLKREQEMVEELATQRWGLAINDTLTAGFYIDTLNFAPSAELLARFPEREFAWSDTLGVNTEAKIWFVGKFLPSAEYPDGFIFDTNIESVHDKFYNRRIAENYRVDDREFATLDFTPEDNKDDLIPAFFKAIPELRRGQWVRIVFTSAYGYGATGLSADVRERQAYYDAVTNYYNQMYMYNEMYSSGYYDNYLDNYYYNGGGNYYNSSPSTYSEKEDEREIVTEVQSYTPLIFEFYVEPEDDEELR